MFKSSKFTSSRNTEPVVVNNITPIQETQVSAPQVTNSANFVTSAFSIVQDGNKWVVVEIPLDPQNQLTGEWIVHPEDGTKMGAQERMKICVARKLFV